MARVKWTTERVEELGTLIESGHAFTEIASEMGTTVSAIKNASMRRGLYARKRYRDSRRVLIVDLYGRGYSAVESAELVGCDADSVRSVLSHLGVNDHLMPLGHLGRRCMPTDECHVILREVAGGARRAEVAERHGVTPRDVTRMAARLEARARDARRVREEMTTREVG